MKNKWTLISSLLAVALLALAVGPGRAQGPEPPGQGTEPQGEVGIEAELLGTAFTYQGQLKSGGNPVNGNCDFQFSLYDSDGTRVGGPLDRNSIPVSNGLFTVQLDFGGTAFRGDARWLEIAVKCAGDADYTTLTTRQALTAAPYALGLRPGADIIGGVSGSALHVQNTSTSGLNYGVYGQSASTDGAGVYGAAPTYGLYGRASAASGTNYGVYGESASNAGYGVFGYASAASGVTYGVRGLSDSTAGRGVYGAANATSGTNYGVYGRSDSTAGLGVFGWATAASGTNYGVYGRSDSTAGRGVYGAANATSGTTYGVYGWSDSTAGRGVYGAANATSGATYGVYGRSASTAGLGVYGAAPTYGVYGYASAASGYTYGVYGESDSTSGRGVYGYASAASGYTYGVYGESDSTSGRGVLGSATAPSGTTYGVFGWSASTAGTGVYGVAYATSGNTRGVYGQSNSTDGIGVYGYSASTTGYAGYFAGRVHVTGNLSAGGTKPFKIDHPLDPANRYLYHFAVESPEVRNVYEGVVTLDANGEAVVTLPAYFEALNTGPYRYQLTPIGAPMPNLYIAQKIQGHTFRIAGGVPGMEVSWEVTAVRNDPYLRDHPAQAEVDKPAEEQGTYLYPEGYGQPKEMGLDYQRNADLLEQVPETEPPSAGGR